MQDILIHGTGGKEVKVHYQGQRGEGIYDVAFEGLIKNVERRYRETGSETMKAEYEEFMQLLPSAEWQLNSLITAVLLLPEYPAL